MNYSTTKIPKFDSTINSYSGHVTLDDKNYFFWYFPHTVKKVVIWLNGGPGCSSLDGVFLENGPFRFINSTLKENPYSWTLEVGMLYVDQPVGTGFSFGTFQNTLQQISSDFNHFLLKFIEIFKLEDYEFYIAGLFIQQGESYAGQYIPYLAKEILKESKINLKSILIGSPWIDPITQYKSIVPYAIKNNLLKNVDIALEQEKKCLEVLTDMMIEHDYCDDIVKVIEKQSRENNQFCINIYDIRLRDQGPDEGKNLIQEGCGMSWPPGAFEMAKYLADPQVKSALNADAYKLSTWVFFFNKNECNPKVRAALKNDPAPPATPLFAELTSQMPIYIYAGDQDIVSNYIGLQNMVDGLKWNGKIGMDSGKMPTKWIKNSTDLGIFIQSGTFVSSRNLTFFIIAGGSHMAPFESQIATRDILLTMIHSTILNENILSKSGPSKFTALLFVLSLLFVAVFGGLQLRKRLFPKWTPIDQEISIELNNID